MQCLFSSPSLSFLSLSPCTSSLSSLNPAYAALSSLFASRQPCDEKPMLPTACAAVRAAGNLSPSPHIHFRTNTSLPKIFPAPTCATLAVTLHSGRHPAKPS